MKSQQIILQIALTCCLLLPTTSMAQQTKEQVVNVLDEALTDAGWVQDDKEAEKNLAAWKRVAQDSSSYNQQLRLIDGISEPKQPSLADRLKREQPGIKLLDSEILYGSLFVREEAYYTRSQNGKTMQYVHLFQVRWSETGTLALIATIHLPSDESLDNAREIAHSQMPLLDYAFSILLHLSYTINLSEVDGAVSFDFEGTRFTLQSPEHWRRVDVTDALVQWVTNDHHTIRVAVLPPSLTVKQWIARMQYGLDSPQRLLEKTRDPVTAYSFSAEQEGEAKLFHNILVTRDSSILLFQAIENHPLEDTNLNTPLATEFTLLLSGAKKEAIDK